MEQENFRKKRAAAIYLLPAAVGILFCFYYLRLAGDNVAYSDYIRLINAYLPDVANPVKFFTPDILTRVPITYLGRLINVKLFGYNTFFDMGLGVISFGLGAVAIAGYAGKEKQVTYPWFLSVLFIYFSLNKWEMLTNGTGWVCFLSISGFYWHYIVLDRAIRNENTEKKDRLILTILPSVLILLIAGPYSGGYSAILFLTYAAMLITNYRKTGKVNKLYLTYMAGVLIPLMFYLLSNRFAVYVHRGAVEASIVEVFAQNPAFFIRFLFKALASIILGATQIEVFRANGSIWGSDIALYLIGAFIAFLYLYALYQTWKHKLWQETALPLILILNGGLNHILILLSRWIFLKESYGMSSRYALQYQMGIIGILLTFAILMSRKQQRKAVKNLNSLIMIISASIILAGNAYTTKEELKTAPYRREYLQISRELGLNYKTAPEADLKTYLQHDPDEVKKAMKILEENNLNIFRENRPIRK